MTARLFAACLLCLSAAAFAQDPPQVEVGFGDLLKFSDLRVGRVSTERERAALANVLRKHIVDRAPRYLPPKARLAVMITDVDMAGDFRGPIGAGMGDVRTVTDLYPPRINLEFKLLDDKGAVVNSGARDLRDMAFLMGASPIGGTELLRFEKDMLDKWLEREFRPKR